MKIVESRRIKFLLIIVVLVAGFFRLFQLGSAELVFDEGLYAFRSIGYLDYLESAAQPTPVQWLDEEHFPFWLKLSFHDHPPFFFLVQYLFFWLFGDSLFVARLPSALAGLTAVLLFFLIGRELFQNHRKRDWLALMSAALASVSFANIMVSRLSMMEGVLFILIVLNFYFFLRFLKNRNYWLVFGVTLGLAFLTKYISFFLLPVYFLFLIFNRSPFIKEKRLYLAGFVALVIFLPVIIYNGFFYSAFGHFDLQFSYLFGQETPFWQGDSGKTQEPFSNILENLLILFSIPFLIISVLGFSMVLFYAPYRRDFLLIFLSLVFITVFLFAVGSAIRFTALYAIPAVFFAVFFFAALLERPPIYKSIILSLFLLFLIYEAVFAADPLFFHPADYGVVKLDQYFDSVLGSGRGPVIPSHPNLYLNRIIQNNIQDRQITLQPLGIIYDDNLAIGPMLWLFSRRQYYHGIPIMSASNFVNFLRAGDKTMFKDFTLYFVKARTGTVIRSTLVIYAQQIENDLKKTGLLPELKLVNVQGLENFNVYKFKL